MNQTNYRYNNNISDINFRYVFQTKKDNGVIQRSVRVDYNKMIDLFLNIISNNLNQIIL